MAAPSDPHPGYGHGGQLAALHRALRRTVDGAGCFVLLEGEAGLGKTHLLRQLRERAAHDRVHVAAAAGHELERDRPFGVLADAVEPRRGTDLPGAGALHALLAVDPDHTQGARRVRYADAVRASLLAAADSEPLAVLLDDVQWADPASVLALDRLAGDVSSSRLLVVLAFRPTPRSGPLARLLRTATDAGAERRRLVPLAEPEVVLMATEMTGAQPGVRLRRLLGTAAGNPLLVRELVSAYDREGLLDRTRDGLVEVTGEELPRSLGEAVRARLTGLDPQTSELLRLAALLGGRFLAGDLAAVAGTTVRALSPALLEARDAGLIEERGELLAFRHDLVREAVYADLGVGLRRALHTEAGHALAAAGAPAHRVAAQLAIGAQPGDAEAVGWLRRAASEAAIRGPQSAADLLGRALELAGDDVEVRIAVQVELLGRLVLAGRPDDAERLARRLLAGALAPELRLLVQGRLAHAIGRQGRLRASAEAFEALATEPALPDRVRAGVQVEAAFCRFWVGDLAVARELCDAALAVSEPAGDTAVTTFALSVRGITAHFGGDLVGADRDLGRAVQLPVGEASSPARAAAVARNPWFFAATHLQFADRVEESDELLAQGRRLAAELGAPWGLPISHVVGAVNRFLTGEWSLAEAEIEAGIILAGHVGTRVCVPGLLAIRALIALHRDHAQRAEHAVDEAEAEPSSGDELFTGGLVAMARALVEERRGAVQDAAAVALAAWRRCSEVGCARGVVEVAPTAARLAVAAGRRDLAAEVAASARAAAEAIRTPSARGAAASAEGHATGDPAAHLAAADAYAEGPRRLEAALAARDAGMAFAGAGRREEARTALRRAQVDLEVLGADADVAGVRAAMRRAQARPGQSAPAVPDRLTPAEHRVAALVREGLTNREIADRLFVSRRTVESHVSSVLRKQGLRSRVELIVRARDSRSTEEA